MRAGGERPCRGAADADGRPPPAPGGRRAPSSPGPRAGFTLVEVLTALVVAGIVATAVVAGVRAVTTWTAEARQRARDANRAGAVRGQLRAWLASAAAPASAEAGGFRFRNASAEGGRDDDELAWTTRAGSPVAPGPARVRLFVDRDSTTAQRGLVAEVSRGGDVTPRRVELAPAATGLDLRFRLASGTRGWTADWTSTRQRPAAVELTVRGDSVSGLLRAPVVVAWSAP